MRPIFTFPDDARWNAERRAIEFGVEVGEYTGRVFVPIEVLRRRGATLSPEEAIAQFEQERCTFEQAVERKVAARQLTDDGDVILLGRDLR
jgi:hypothetical protein